jgi:N6-adenosine-specific RNA methylase IME4
MEIGKKYKLIYADPAWKFNHTAKFEKHRPSKFGANFHYDTMELTELKELPIRNISEKDSCLFMWCTISLLPDGIELLKSWGFDYKTSIIWNKINSLGLGFWFRNNVEILLVGVKGQIKPFRCQKPNIINCKVGKHSQKPRGVYTLLESLKLDPKIELFARHKREGWDVWGNQVPDYEQKTLGGDS